jgi:hypothetical protein
MREASKRRGRPSGSVSIGWARSDGERVVDFGCGSGVAARAYAQRFGAGRVRLVDRSRTAAQWAADALRAACPAVPTQAASDAGNEPPDVLLVSHVLGELDAAGEQRLEALARRSRRVLWVEPGSKALARRLSALRDRVCGAPGGVPDRRPAAAPGAASPSAAAAGPAKRGARARTRRGGSGWRRTRCAGSSTTSPRPSPARSRSRT